MLDNEEELTKQILSGNRDSFRVLFNEYFPKLYHFAYDFVKDRDVAREISHETFVKLWESRNNLQPDSSLGSLLFTICRNQSLNFLKHRKVMLKYQEVKYIDQAEQELLTSVLSEYNFNELDFAVLKKKVIQAIHNLPEQCRLVFELSRFKKKKYSQIATQLNISVKTVEAHISLALRKLREDLKEFL